MRKEYKRGCQEILQEVVVMAIAVTGVQEHIAGNGIASWPRELLASGEELDLGQIVYVHLDGKPNRITIGQVEVQDASYLWIAHEPSVIAVAETPFGYRRGRFDCIEVFAPQVISGQGQRLTLEGFVNVPEAHGPFVNMQLTETVVHRLKKDPYFVTIGSANGTREYRNVPQVEINFL